MNKSNDLKSTFNKFSDFNDIGGFHKLNSQYILQMENNKKDVNGILKNYKKFSNNIDNGRSHKESVINRKLAQSVLLNHNS